VGVSVARISRQQPFECGQQIGFGSRARFHQGHSRRRMRHENAHEAVTEIGAEPFHIPRQVDDPRSGSVHVEFDRVHWPIFCPFRHRPVTTDSGRGMRATGAGGWHQWPGNQKSRAMLGPGTPGYPFAVPMIAVGSAAC